MSFIDRLGDAWDAVFDGAGMTLGIGMDMAKASEWYFDAVGSGLQGNYNAKHIRDSARFQTARFFDTYAGRREKYAEAHKTVARIGGFLKDQQVGALESIEYAADKGKRAVDTYSISQGNLSPTSLVPGVGPDTGKSFGEAWALSRRTSFGQSEMVNVTRGFDLDERRWPTRVEDAWRYGTRGDERYNPWFSLGSGTLDFMNAWYVDPLIVGGKAIKVGRHLRRTLTPEDLRVLERKADLMPDEGTMFPVSSEAVRTLTDSQLAEHWGRIVAQRELEESRGYTNPFQDQVQRGKDYDIEVLRRLRLHENDPEWEARFARFANDLGGPLPYPAQQALDTLRNLGDDELSSLRRVDPHKVIPEGTTRRQRKILREEENLLDWLMGKDALTIMAHPAMRGNIRSATLSHLLAAAATREEKRLLLLSARGSRLAHEQLRAIHTSLANRLEEANMDLDDLIWMEKEAQNSYVDGETFFSLVNRQNRDQLEAEVRDLNAATDLLHRAVGDADAMHHANLMRTVPNPDDVGIWGARIGDRLRAPGWIDRKRIESMANYTIQDGWFGVPIRIMRAPLNQRGSGRVDLHDAEQAFEEVDAMLRHVPNLTPVERREMLNHFLSGTDDNARRQILFGIENRVMERIGDDLGYTKDEMQQVLTKISNEREQMLMHLKTQNYGWLPDGTAIRPLMETQLANSVPIIDAQQIYRVLKRNRDGWMAMKAGGAKDFVFHMGDFINDIWKFQALFRGGYLLRNIVDSQLRLLMYLGTLDTLRLQLGEGATRAVQRGISGRRAGIEFRNVLDELEDLKERRSFFETGLIPETAWDRAAKRLEKYGIYKPVPPRVSEEADPLEWENYRLALVNYHERVRNDVLLIDDEIAPLNLDDPEIRADQIARFDYEIGALEDLKKQGPNAFREPVAGGGRFLDETGDDWHSDAFGMTEDEIQFRRRANSSVDSHLDMVRRDFERNLEYFRGTGNWKTLTDSDDPVEYASAYLRVVNQHFRQSAITERLLKGWHPDDVVAWLKSSQGRSIRRRMVFGDETAENLVEGNLQNLAHVLPPEWWETAARRPLTVDDLRQIFPGRKPEINAEQIAYSMGQHPIAKAYGNIRDKYFNFVGRASDDVMGRHPLYRQLYRGRYRELLATFDEGENVPYAMRQVMEEQSRAFARREMKRVMFDVSRKTDLGHFVRFVMPFYSAWQDAVTKYSRLIVRDPGLLVKAGEVWTFPNDAFGSSDSSDRGNVIDVVDSLTGKPVPGGRSRLTDNEVIRIPQKWADKFGLDYTLDISKASLNIALQGDPIWMPGWGPMAQAPVNQFVRWQDSPDLAKFAQEIGILPFGVQDYGTLGYKAFFAGALRQMATPDSRWARMKAMILQRELHQTRLGERKEPPTPDEINKKFWGLVALRAVTNALSPFSIQYKSPYQFYIDESHSYDRQIGPGKRFKDSIEADKAFYEEHGENFYLFRTSMSKNRVGIMASQKADKVARRYKDLIGKHPEFGWLIVGPNNDGEYDQNVYILQSLRKLNPLTEQTWRDTYENPQDAFAANNAEIGWIEYTKMTEQLDAILEQRGLTSYRQKGAADLANIKREWINRVADPENGPTWGRDWYKDYRQVDGSRIIRFLEAARDAVADPRLRERKDIEAIGLYLTARDAFKQVLDARRSAGGSGTLAGNDDLAARWDLIMAELKSRYPQFGDIYSRHLETDDLSAVG